MIRPEFWAIHLPIASLAAALVLLIALWLFALLRVTAGPRHNLLGAGAAVFLLATVLFGGEAILNRNGLMWRQLFCVFLSLLLWGAGWAASGMTVYYIPQAVKGTWCGRCLRAAAALCLVIAMGWGTFFGGLWAWRGAEQTGKWGGERVVFVLYANTYDFAPVYEYHGPFVRSDGAIGFADANAIRRGELK